MGGGQFSGLISFESVGGFSVHFSVSVFSLLWKANLTACIQFSFDWRNPPQYTSIACPLYSCSLYIFCKKTKWCFLHFISLCIFCWLLRFCWFVSLLLILWIHPSPPLLSPRCLSKSSYGVWLWLLMKVTGGEVGGSNRYMERSSLLVMVHVDNIFVSDPWVVHTFGFLYDDS